MPKTSYLDTIIFYAIVNIGVIIAVRNIYIYNRMFFNDFFNNVESFSMVVLGSFFLTISLHEFGHFFFGKIFGFKLIEINIWIFSFTKKETNKFRLKVNFDRIFSFNGFTFMKVSRLERFVIKETIFLAGGIIVNLITFISILVFLQGNSSMDYTLKEYLLIFAYMSFVIALMNSLPINHGDVSFDGRKIYDLFTDVSFRNCLMIDNLDIQGIRPREWINYNLFDVTRESELLEHDFILKLHELLAYMDKKDIETTNRLITNLLADVRETSIYLHDRILLTCSVFYSFIDVQPERVKSCIGSLKHKFNPPSLTRAYIEIIQSRLNNDYPNLTKYGNNFLELLNSSVFKGSMIFYSDLLAIEQN